MADTKKMIHDAYGLFKMQPNGNGGDPESAHNYAIGRGTWAGKVMTAVEKQARPLGDILILCYAPEWEDVNFDTLHRHLFGEFIRLRGDEIKQDRTFIKAKHLAEVAIFNFQHECRTGPMATDHVCMMAGIDRSHWYKADRNWRSWWDSMGAILHRWEREAIRQPARVCEEMTALEQKEWMQMAAV